MYLYSKKEKAYVKDFKFEGVNLYYDIETTGLNHATDTAFFIGWGDDAKNDYALSLKNGEVDKDTRAILKRLGKLFADDKVVKVNQNIWFDNWFLTKDFGFVFNGRVIDILPYARLLVITGLTRGEPVNYKLGTLTQFFLGRSSDQKKKMDDFFKGNPYLKSPYTTDATGAVGVEQMRIDGGKDFIKQKQPKEKDEKENRDYTTVPTEQMVEYVLADIDDPRDLYKLFREKTPADMVEAVNLEMDLAPYMYAIKQRGFAIDKKFLRAYRVEILTELHDLEKEIYAEVGEFNIMSDEQMGAIVFGNLGFKASNYTKLGKPQVDKFTLEKIVHPTVDKIQKFRKLSKSRLAFIDSLLEKADDEGVVHCYFNQLGARTGRMSASNPNLQNIPKRGDDDESPKIRQGFVPRKGFTLYAFDYSQIEYRLFAYYLGDQRLLTALNAGADFHALTAIMFFGDIKYRAKAKTINFGLIYGMGDASLAGALKVDVSEATRLRAEYFSKLPLYRSLTNRVYGVVDSRGYIKTLVGRRRPIFRDQAYIGLNSIIQGSAGDIFKKAVIAVSRLLVARQSRIVNMVHDEILFEIADGEQDVVAEIKRTMESVVDLGVALTVDIKYGDNWGTTKPYIPKAVKTEKRKVPKNGKEKKSKNARR